MITYQDYEKATDKTRFVQDSINKYRRSKEFKKAQEEQEYMAGRNTEILNTRRIIYDMGIWRGDDASPVTGVAWMSVSAH